jgi:hypothetical protein
VNINNVSIIYILCNLVNSQTVYKEHVGDKILYSFYPNVGPGEKINLRDEASQHARQGNAVLMTISFSYGKG